MRLLFLGSGSSIEDLDDSAQMGRKTIRFYFNPFRKDVGVIYGDVYLNRRPGPEQMEGMQETYVGVGFEGCVGAIHCMKLKWENCPFQRKG